MAIVLKQWKVGYNAGDMFSARVVEHLTGRNVEIVGEAPEPRPNLIGLGSILHWADEQSTVWGTGFLDGDVLPHGGPREVLAVRGPLTAARLRQLGIPCPARYGDPGVLAPDVFPPSESRYPLGIVPHYADWDDPWVRGMAAQGAAVIDPLSPLDIYMDRLSACEHIVSSSLHGLVFAHAYGIPAVWARLSDRVLGDGFKFFDYYASVGVPAEGVVIIGRDADLRRATTTCSLPPREVDGIALAGALREHFG